MTGSDQNNSKSSEKLKNHEKYEEIEKIENLTNNKPNQQQTPQKPTENDKKPKSSLKEYKIIQKSINHLYLEIDTNENLTKNLKTLNLTQITRDQFDLEKLFLAEVEGSIYRATTMSAGELLLIDVMEYIGFDFVTRFFRCPENIENVERKTRKIRNLGFKKASWSEKSLKIDLMEYRVVLQKMMRKWAENGRI